MLGLPRPAGTHRVTRMDSGLLRAGWGSSTPQAGTLPCPCLSEVAGRQAGTLPGLGHCLHLLPLPHHITPWQWG